MGGIIMNMKTYVTAREAHFTLESQKTSARYTYKVNLYNGTWFVDLKVFTGRKSTYEYIGYFRKDLVLRASVTSAVSPVTPMFQAMKYFLNHIGDLQNIIVYDNSFTELN